MKALLILFALLALPFATFAPPVDAAPPANAAVARCPATSSVASRFATCCVWRPVRLRVVHAGNAHRRGNRRTLPEPSRSYRLAGFLCAILKVGHASPILLAMSQAATTPEVDLREDTWSGECRIDREAGIIRGVHILGLEAPDKQRRYSSDASRGAVAMLEGAEVNIDHPADAAASRGMSEGWGWLRNVTFREGSGNWGDLEYLKSHPLTEMVLERAERDGGKRLGLSINARGTRRDAENGWHVVEEITRVRSVDLVRNPATVAGLHESTIEEPAEMAKPKQITRKAFLEPLAEKSKPAKCLLELLEMDDPMADPEAMVDEMPTISPEEQIDYAFQDMIIAIFNEGGDDAAILAKIKQLLKARSGVVDAVSDAPAEDAPADEEAAMAESRVERLEIELHARDLIEAKGFTMSDLSDARKRLVKAAPSKQAAADLVESFELVEQTAVTKPTIKTKGAARNGSKTYDEMRESVRAEKPKSRFRLPS